MAVTGTGNSSAQASLLYSQGMEQFAAGKASAAKKSFDKAVGLDPRLADTIGAFYHSHTKADDKPDVQRALHASAKSYFERSTGAEPAPTVPAANLCQVARECLEVSH